MDDKSTSLPEPRSGRAKARIRWLEAAITTAPEQVQFVADFLLDLGSTGLITGITDYTKPRRSSQETVCGFFPLEQSARIREAVRRLDKSWPHDLKPPRITYRALDQKHWEANWQEHFKPIAVGRRLLVIPPWLKPASKRIHIVINPGMAFGTGQHETTQACLAAIDRLLLKRRLRLALDLGTGTGILSIAMARLGVREIIAIDTDPLALSSARENLKLNRVINRVRLSRRPLPKLRLGSRRVSLAVANLYAEVLVKLEKDLYRVLRPGGVLIASGVTDSREGILLDSFARKRWLRAGRRARGEWITRTLRRRPAG